MVETTLYRTDAVDKQLLDCVLDGLTRLKPLPPSVRQDLTGIADYGIQLLTLETAHQNIVSFFMKEAAEMSLDEPFVGHYIVGFQDSDEQVLLCDVELSSPNVEARTYYGVSAIRLGSDDYAVDLEGASRFSSIVRKLYH